MRASFLALTTASVIVALPANAQHLPATAPAGMDPLSTLFIEACERYSRGIHNDDGTLAAAGFTFLGGFALDGDDDQPDHTSRFGNFLPGTERNHEQAQITFIKRYHDDGRPDYFCHLLVDEDTNAQNRFSPNSFHLLTDFDYYPPRHGDVGYSATEDWEVDARDRYTKISLDSQDGDWSVTITSYPR